MSIAEIQVARSAKLASDAPEPGSPEQAAKNREIARAVKVLNDGGGVGAGSEVRFAIDQTSGDVLIRIVDRVTDEVIRQIPSESIIRMAEVLKSLGPGDGWPKTERHMTAHIYAENDILHQSGVELVCLLYSEAIARVSSALERLETSQSQERGAAIGGAMAIIVELQGSLDQNAGGQIANDLARLYDYIQDRLITGHAEQNAKPLIDARIVLKTLLAGWRECRAALDEAVQAPVEELAAAGSRRRAWTL